ncbi:MAG: carboxypeptidase regulatory-like domain-containing protein [Planctomycetes bacterium]|nr:carboxypeptidase regulatory-like domain-containing protein [Planctomycetota bacterium]
MHKRRETLLFLFALLIAVGALFSLPSRATVHSDGTPSTNAPEPPAALQIEVRSPTVQAEARTLVTDESPSAPRRTGSIQVRVLVGSGERQRPGADFPIRFEPMAGANPDFDTPVIRADRDGLATASGLRPGPVVVRAAQGASEYKPVEVVAGRTHRIDLHIAEVISITGKVVDTSDRPIAGATLEIVPLSVAAAQMPVAESGPDGSFSVPAALRPCLIGARAPGFYSNHLVETGVDDTLELTLVLTRGGGGVRGRVTDAQRRPIAGARVRIGTPRTEGFHALPHPSGRSAFRRAQTELRTDGDGWFHVFGLEPGTQPIMVRSRNHAPWSGSCTVHADTTVPVEIELQPGAVCSGTVLQHDGSPARGCRIGVRNGPDFLRVQALTARDGSYRLQGLPSGTVELIAKHRHHLRGDAGTRLELDAGETATWSPRLSGGVTFHARIVTDSTPPRPLAECALQVGVKADGLGAPLRMVHRITDRDGRIELRNVRPGPVVSLSLITGVPTPIHRSGIDATAGEYMLVVPDPGRATATVRGRVLAADGRPIPHCSAVLLVSRFPKQTCNPDPHTGAFEFGTLLAHTYRLRLQAPGFVPRVLEHTLEEGACWDADLVTLERAGWIAVPTGDIQPELRGAVELWVRDAQSIAVARIDCAGGAARSIPLAPGRYALEVRGAGIAHACMSVQVHGGKGTTVHPPIRRGVACVLTVALPGGLGAEPRVHLSVRCAGGTAVDRILPEAVGLLRSYRCALLPGTHTVEARVGDRTVQQEIEVPAGGKLPASYEIRVR